MQLPQSQKTNQREGGWGLFFRRGAETSGGGGTGPAAREGLRARRQAHLQVRAGRAEQGVLIARANTLSPRVLAPHANSLPDRLRRNPSSYSPAGAILMCDTYTR